MRRRKRSGGGRFIALQRLGYYLRTPLREFILSFTLKFLFVTRRRERYSMITTILLKRLMIMEELGLKD